MGKGGSGGTKKYFGSCAGVVCAGPVDELVSFIVDGSTVWPTKKHWANGAFDVPIVTLQRKSNRARVEVGQSNGITHGYVPMWGSAVYDKVIVSGCSDPSFDTDAAGVAAQNFSDVAVWYDNPGPDVARTNLSGSFTAVLHYSLGDILAHAGGIWRSLSAHYGTPDTAPPNATYWEPVTVKRAEEANPFAFTVEDYGQCYFYWGTDDQVLDATGEEILTKYGHPPYRRQAVIVIKSFLFGMERQSAPNIELVVRKAPRQTVIDSALDSGHQSNPLAAALDLLTDPVHGAGASNAIFAPWQAVADSLAASADKTHISPLIDSAESSRSFLASLLTYYDGWLRFSREGLIEAGRFLHNEAPPVFTAATTLDYHDLVEEPSWDAGGWAQTSNETVVKFDDASRAFKDAARMFPSSFNRAVTGEPRRVSIDRPWITRERQAADHAAEWGKINAQPFISGSLVVRSEKAAEIQPGTLFLLTHDAIGFSIACRCTEKTLAAPPVGRATLRFESERGIAPLPFQPARPTIQLPRAYVPDGIYPFQFVQPPASLSGANRLCVLAPRKNSMTTGFRLWMQKDDPALFTKLGEQSRWAVAGELTQDYDDQLPIDGTNPADDDTETLQVELTDFTDAGDLERVMATQTADSINDDSILVFLFSAADPTQFEICALKAIRLDTVYKLKVRRARFGTTKKDFLAADSCYLIPRADLVSYSHTEFAGYVAGAVAVTFRLQSFGPATEADLSDPDVCPDIGYQFVTV